MMNEMLTKLWSQNLDELIWLVSFEVETLS